MRRIVRCGNRLKKIVLLDRSWCHTLSMLLQWQCYKYHFSSIACLIARRLSTQPGYRLPLSTVVTKKLISFTYNLLLTYPVGGRKLPTVVLHLIHNIRWHFILCPSAEENRNYQIMTKYLSKRDFPVLLDDTRSPHWWCAHYGYHPIVIHHSQVA